MIINKINNKIYIGKRQNSNPENDEYMGSGLLIKRAYNKYGIDNFIKEILECCNTLEDLNLKEKYWINYYKSTDKKIGYNIGLGGDGGDNYTNNPNKIQISKKLSNRRKQYLELHPEFIKYLSEVFKEKYKNNPEIFKQAGQKRCGKNNGWFDKGYLQEGEDNPNYGNKWSESQKENLSKKIKGKYIGENNPNYNNKWSDKQKENLSYKMKGKYKDENNPNAKSVVRVEDLKIYKTIKSACLDNNISYKQIHKSINNGKKYNGYSFKYL
jgi:group I intron endonuclease